MHHTSSSSSAMPGGQSAAVGPFALGVALGLGALLALQRERFRAAPVLALLCPLASPSGDNAALAETGR